MAVAEIQTTVQASPDVLRWLSLIAPVIACGYAVKGEVKKMLHDHGRKYTVDVPSFNPATTVRPYRQEDDGDIVEFINEGERVPDWGNSKDGRAPIHRHSRVSSGGMIGPYEFQYEEFTPTPSSPEKSTSE